MRFESRQIGRSGILVTPLAMGCWPIAGITSIDVSEDFSLATLEAAADAGLNFFDTAYCYGYDGESEKMIARALGHRRDQLVIATKGGIHYDNRIQTRDASPATLIRECDESLKRLNTNYIDLYYLHAPDPKTPVSESAGAMNKLLEADKIRSVGVSNFNRDQLDDFHSVCAISAFQPQYNMLQREIETSQVPWCIEHGVSVIAYWPLMKGLLAGKMPRNHQFDPRDGRKKYPMFSGTEWEKNQDFLDQLRPIAADCKATLSQLVLNWTIQRPFITVAICGAKRPDQILDNAGALHWKLTADQIARIDQAIADRGEIISRSAV